MTLLAFPSFLPSSICGRTSTSFPILSYICTRRRGGGRASATLVFHSVLISKECTTWKRRRRMPPKIGKEKESIITFRHFSLPYEWDTKISKLILITPIYCQLFYGYCFVPTSVPLPTALFPPSPIATLSIAFIDANACTTNDWAFPALS